MLILAAIWSFIKKLCSKISIKIKMIIIIFIILTTVIFSLFNKYKNNIYQEMSYYNTTKELQANIDTMQQQIDQNQKIISDLEKENQNIRNEITGIQNEPLTDPKDITMNGIDKYFDERGF